MGWREHAREGVGGGRAKKGSNFHSVGGRGIENERGGKEYLLPTDVLGDYRV